MATSITENIDGFYYHRTENKTCSNSTQHYHSGFEIYYMREGKCHYFINDTSFDVISGDIILIPQEILHGTSYGSKPCSRLLINFDVSFINPEILETIKGVGYLYRNPSTINAINGIFDLIEGEYNRSDNISKIALKGFVEMLLIIMLRNQPEKIKQENNTIVQAAIKYIQNNYMSTIRLADVAKMLSVSEEHLSRTFKKEITFGFSEYITLIRLQKAEHMLKNEPSRAVTEVAYACGFNDSNYFSYKFKKAYGITPSEVRDGKNALDPEPPHYSNLR
jgi:AraC-like DNA-binding protein